MCSLFNPDCFGDVEFMIMGSQSFDQGTTDICSRDLYHTVLSEVCRNTASTLLNHWQNFMKNLSEL
jgi:hypothetical protein